MDPRPGPHDPPSPDHPAAVAEADAAEVEHDFDAVPPGPRRVPVVRTLVAGFLMGTANLVPGVSGGTMVLVCGLYAHFVDATADLTRLKFSKAAFGFIGLLFAAKFAAMGLLGEFVAEAVVRHRTIAYALFLGMTLAGTPVLWRVLRKPLADARPRRVGWLMVPVGVALMAALAVVSFGGKSEFDPDAEYRPAQNVPLDATAGAAAYSAMVLPGVSGGTVKLALGRYEPTVWSIGQAGQAVVGRAAPAGAWLPILLPYVGGAVVGLIAVSNALKWLLKKYELPMTGLLLGVLWGSVLPIWPYRGEATTLQIALSIPAALIGFAAVYALTLWKDKGYAAASPAE